MARRLCSSIPSLVLLITIPIPILNTSPLHTLTTWPLLMLPILPFTPLTTGSKGPSCCFPDKFQATMTNLLQPNKSVYKFTRMAMDYEAKRVVLLLYERNTTCITGNTTLLRRTVGALTENKTTYYITESSGSCTNLTIPYKFMKCLPQNRTYVGRFYIGFNSVGISANYYQFNYDFNGTLHYFGLSIQIQPGEDGSEDICVPVFQTISYLNTDIYAQPTAFSEFQPNITDDFNMTIGC